MLTVYYPMKIVDAIRINRSCEILGDMHDRDIIEKAEYFAKLEECSIITCRDIFVRRLLRLVQSGELASERLQIIFVDIGGKATTLSMNSYGQIHDWPDGFMDEDVKESQRWLETRFGCKIEY